MGFSELALTIPVTFPLHNNFQVFKYLKETISLHPFRLKSAFTSFHYGRFCAFLSTGRNFRVGFEKFISSFPQIVPRHNVF